MRDDVPALCKLKRDPQLRDFVKDSLVSQQGNSDYIDTSVSLTGQVVQIDHVVPLCEPFNGIDCESNLGAVTANTHAIKSREEMEIYNKYADYEKKTTTRCTEQELERMKEEVDRGVAEHNCHYKNPGCQQ